MSKTKLCGLLDSRLSVEVLRAHRVVCDVAADRCASAQSDAGSTEDNGALAAGEPDRVTMGREMRRQLTARTPFQRFARWLRDYPADAMIALARLWHAKFTGRRDKLSTSGILRLRNPMGRM